jgi:hypothetical protein
MDSSRLPETSKAVAPVMAISDEDNNGQVGTAELIPLRHFMGMQVNTSGSDRYVARASYP